MADDFRDRHVDGVRVSASQCLVEDDAERVDVRPRVHLVGVPAGLLGGHVGVRPVDAAGDGDHRFGGLGQRLGQAEVEHAGVAVHVHEDVARLEVAVDDAALVGVVHRLANRGEQGQHRPQAQAVLAHVLRDRDAADVIHYAEGVPVRRRAAVEDRDHVGVLEAGDQLDLPLEPPAGDFEANAPASSTLIATLRLVDRCTAR